MAVKVDPIIKLLVGLLIVLVCCMFASEVWFKADGQFFQAVFSMASGVLGAILGLVKGTTGDKPVADPATTAVIDASIPLTPPPAPIPASHSETGS